MALKLYQIDAFASALFGGNPAAVIKVDAFLPEPLMQDIASENNLSETAFVVPGDMPHHYDLRWFTPAAEIDFCGHATIATAHALAAEYGDEPPFHFHTKVGELVVSVSEGLYVMDAPVSKGRPAPITDEIKAAFPVDITDVFWGSDNLFVVFASEGDVRKFVPDMSLLRPLSDHGVGITAKGQGSLDCVSRFFVPAMGIDEDAVTGSAHAAIGPYWAEKLGKTNLKAYQASERGGILELNIGNDRLTIAGQAITYMQGEIRL